VGAAGVIDSFLFVCGFDAFGDNAHTQFVGETGDRANDRHRLVLVDLSGNEAAVDLDL